MLKTAIYLLKLASSLLGSLTCKLWRHSDHKHKQRLNKCFKTFSSAVLAVMEWLHNSWLVMKNTWHSIPRGSLPTPTILNWKYWRHDKTCLRQPPPSSNSDIYQQYSQRFVYLQEIKSFVLTNSLNCYWLIDCNTITSLVSSNLSYLVSWR